MSVRFLKISSYYRDFLAHYYEKYPQIKTGSFISQHNHLMQQHFAWSDNYGRLLNEKGLETMEIVANAMPLQQAWLREKGFPGHLSLYEIIIKQIESFKPEIIYFQDSITFNGPFIKELKRRFPFIKRCIGNICAPFTSSHIQSFQQFDYLTVCSQIFKYQLNKYNIQSIVIPHAFDQRILSAIKQDNPYPQSPFIFTGSIFPDEGFHSIRRQVLEKLVEENIPFDFYGNLPDNSRVRLLKKQASYFAAKILDGTGFKSITEKVPLIKKGRNHSSLPKNLKLSSQLYRKAKPPIFGIDMFKALSRANIGFNIHGDCAGAYVANMRMFETTGAGACLLTDRKKDLHKYFEEDKEVVTYSSADECIEKVKWLIDNPDKCRQIAQNGQKRTLKEHHFSNRIELFYTDMINWI